MDLYLNPIKIDKKNNCTWFILKFQNLDARKKWIISSISPKGELLSMMVQKKHLNGKSLLAAGIKKVSGKFKKVIHIKF